MVTVCPQVGSVNSNVVFCKSIFLRSFCRAFASTAEMRARIHTSLSKRAFVVNLHPLYFSGVPSNFPMLVTPRRSTSGSFNSFSIKHFMDAVLASVLPVLTTFVVSASSFPPSSFAAAPVPAPSPVLIIVIMFSIWDRRSFICDSHGAAGGTGASSVAETAVGSWASRIFLNSSTSVASMLGRSESGRATATFAFACAAPSDVSIVLSVSGGRALSIAATLALAMTPQNFARAFPT